MKDEKFCFKKGTGLIALVGIVLVLAVFAMNTATSQQQTTGAKAFLGCPDSSLPVYGAGIGNKCDDDKIARDINGAVMTDNSGRTCCYLGSAYTTHCPSGSTPDPSKWCGKAKVGKIVMGAKAIKTDGTEVQCCNWHGSVQGTPAAAASAAPAEVINTVDATNVLSQQPSDFCTKHGLFNPNPTFAVSYYNLYCSGVKPTWNNPKCYAAVGMCGSKNDCDREDCMRGQDATHRCLNVEVPFSVCLNAGVATQKDDPAFTGPRCADGLTCAGGVAMNTCAPKSTKKCICKNGATYPTYEERPGECVVEPKTYNCMYGDQVVISNSVPYKYVTSSVTQTKRCIVDAAGKNTGYACKTDASGVIYANGSVRDEVNCKAYISTCIDKDATWKAQKYNCSGVAEYGKCTPDKYRCACYESNWPTLKYDPNCP